MSIITVNQDKLRKSSVPESVSIAQGTAALINAGKWQAVLDYVTSIADANQKALAEVALYKTSEWRRDSAFLKKVSQAVGITETELDDLFIAAKQITF